MARKSRKPNNQGTAFVPKISSVRAAAYVRLSTEDILQKGDSIETQKLMINQYMELYPLFELYDTYVDMVAGTTFERPEFSRMMADIEAGKVNCVIVKDLSRLGRNLIETGYYIEKLFPTIGVRIISLNDNLDSAVHTDYIALAVKNMMNEAYVLDIAVKTRSQARLAMERGIYVGGRPPYGYVRAVDDRHKLCVDAEAAEVVRNIFQWAASEIASHEIARRLNMGSILPPSRYKAKCSKISEAEKGSGIWYARTIQQILSNPIYIGKMVQGKTKSKLFQRKPTEPEEWICVDDAHEAVVDIATFEAVQLLRQKTPKNTGNTPRKPYPPNLFKGKIFCGHCGHPLERKKSGGAYVYRCVINRTAPNTCIGNRISENAVKTALLEQLILYRATLANDTHVDFDKKGILAELQWIELELERITGLTMGMYENYVKLIISAQEYKELREGYQRKIDEHNQRTRELMRVLEDGRLRTAWVEESIRILDELVVSMRIDSVHVKRFVERVNSLQLSVVLEFRVV